MVLLFFSLTCLSHVGKDGTVGAAEFAAGLTSMGINTESRQAVLWLWFLILIREKKQRATVATLTPLCSFRRVQHIVQQCSQNNGRVDYNHFMAEMQVVLAPSGLYAPRLLTFFVCCTPCRARTMLPSSKRSRPSTVRTLMHRSSALTLTMLHCCHAQALRTQSPLEARPRRERGV